MMFGLSDTQLLGLTLYGECRGEPITGKLAVASVIRNRVHSGRWGASYSTVVFAPKQFSCWNIDDPNLPILRELGQALSSGVTPADAALVTCLWVADGTVRQLFDSTVRDAMHYFAATLPTPPAWATGAEMVAHIGAHLFFRGVK